MTRLVEADAEEPHVRDTAARESGDGVDRVVRCQVGSQVAVAVDQKARKATTAPRRRTPGEWLGEGRRGS